MHEVPAAPDRGDQGAAVAHIPAHRREAGTRRQPRRRAPHQRPHRVPGARAARRARDLPTNPVAPVRNTSSATFDAPQRRRGTSSQWGLAQAAAQCRRARGADGEPVRRRSPRRRCASPAPLGEAETTCSHAISRSSAEVPLPSAPWEPEEIRPRQLTLAICPRMVSPAARSPSRSDAERRRHRGRLVAAVGHAVGAARIASAPVAAPSRWSPAAPCRRRHSRRPSGSRAAASRRPSSRGSPTRCTGSRPSPPGSRGRAASG